MAFRRGRERVGVERLLYESELPVLAGSSSVVASSASALRFFELFEWLAALEFFSFFFGGGSTEAFFVFSAKATGASGLVSSLIDLAGLTLVCNQRARIRGSSEQHFSGFTLDLDFIGECSPGIPPFDVMSTFLVDFDCLSSFRFFLREKSTRLSSGLCVPADETETSVGSSDQSSRTIEAADFGEFACGGMSTRGSSTRSFSSSSFVCNGIDDDVDVGVGLTGVLGTTSESNNILFLVFSRSSMLISNFFFNLPDW